MEFVYEMFQFLIVLLYFVAIGPNYVVPLHNFLHLAPPLTCMFSLLFI